MNRLTQYFRDAKLAKEQLNFAAYNFDRSVPTRQVLGQLLRSVQSMQAAINCVASLQFKKKPRKISASPRSD